MSKSKQIIFIISLLIASWSDPAASSPPESSCGEGRVPGHAVIVLIDYTDRIAEAALMEAAHALHRYRDELKQDDRLTVLALYASASNQDAVLDSIFSACKPQPPETANRWIQNPRKIKERYEAAWNTPLTEIASVLSQFNSNRAATSPLLQVLEQIANASEFKGQQRTLVLFSDLLEHTALYSMYDGAPDFQALRDKRFAWAHIEGLFQNTDVHITRLANPERSRHQTPAVERFWLNYFAGAGVDSSRMTLNNLDRQKPGSGPVPGTSRSPR